MSIVTLNDGTVYYIDTDERYRAEHVVDYKLRQRLDYRKIDNIKLMEGVLVDKESKYYNSGDAYDMKELRCVKGWSYKWR